MARKASESVLNDIHRLLAQIMKGRLEEAASDPEKALTAAEMGQVIAFLKTNGVLMDASGDGALNALEEELKNRTARREERGENTIRIRDEEFLRSAFNHGDGIPN